MVKFLSAEKAVISLVHGEISIEDLGKSVVIQLGNQQDHHAIVSSLSIENPEFIDLRWDKETDAFECAVMAVASYIDRRRNGRGIKKAPNHVAARPEQLVPPMMVTTKPAYVPECPFVVCEDFAPTTKKVGLTCPTAG